jgi:hypothetical protein
VSGPPLPPPPGPVLPPAPAGGPPGWAPGPKTNGMAVAAMVLGIVGLVMVPFIGAILALVFGYLSRGSIDRSNGLEGGRSMAVAGIILGYVGLVTSVLWVFYFIWFFGHFDTIFRDMLNNLPSPSP